MTRVCQITGKRPMNGNKRSHAMNATKRWFIPNIHSHRFWIDSKKRYFTLRISTKGMRLIDKLGIEYCLSNLYSKNK
ncbi:50S ribosomal protein L28 [Candidatus Blochmannia vicinus]|uniref:Large ribosomal subunit protein bL28 n=1 Tax=Candidatus Blochmannia vicinus (nom. nud.) TaxID=251540 RepID=A0A9Q8X106_9ENTR|nr:50S ribosomal protein L28 [Candidatus Blochmannia vicinus]URJ28178.1 50S ribosomal protein L28 [Candidatus Blochmannia vicinus]URJ30545.1 50S ribosomal protein L28 [Candidatus Blochmannia vicinus]URJ33249.1 50S ribosomal protein L28 [Candidatus Blochmannia vicinus]